jgi:hypothetical protein
MASVLSGWTAPSLSINSGELHLDQPIIPSSSWEDWKPKKRSKGSLPLRYQISGYLLRPIRVGECMIVLRTERNGVQAFGIFCTSEVSSFEKGILKTQNSVYHVETRSVYFLKKGPPESSSC